MTGIISLDVEGRVIRFLMERENHVLLLAPAKNPVVPVF